jgi:hypothetical protein
MISPGKSKISDLIGAECSRMVVVRTKGRQKWGDIGQIVQFSVSRDNLILEVC